MVRGSPQSRARSSTPRTRGRPKIGVVSYEVTLPAAIWGVIRQQEEATGLYRCELIRIACESYFGATT